jgi:hypothetical protein
MVLLAVKGFSQIPRIMGISPGSGPVGTSVTLSGRDFAYFGYDKFITAYCLK